MLPWTLISAALANDAPFSAIGDAGQLELTTESEIFIARELLEVGDSARPGADFHVRVTYTFRNPTAEPRQVQLAFPLADAPLARLYHYERHAPEMELRVGGARYDGGSWLVSLSKGGAPLVGADRSTWVDAHGQWDVDRICAAGRAVDPTLRCDAGREGVGETWFRATYVWEHTFPPGDTTIVHEYETTGARAESADGTARWTEAERACAPIGYRGRQQALTYVLTTASRWARPIGEFELVVRPGPEGATMASCFSGLAAAGDGTFRARRTSFTPTEELTVLFYVPTGAKVAPGSVSPDQDRCGFHELLTEVLQGRPLDAVHLQCASPGCTESGPAWSPEALRLLRNALFARHGRPFESADLTAYFYQGGARRPADQVARECPVGEAAIPPLAPDRGYTDARLTEVDRANRSRIQQAEAASPPRR